MLNLLIKDIKILKGTRAWPFSILFVVCAALIYGSNPSISLMFAIMPIYYLVMVSQSLDLRYGAEGMLASLPLERATIIQAKYCSVLLYAIPSLAAIALLSVASAAAGMKTAPVSGNFTATLLSAVLLMNAVSYPLYYKFGFAKSRLAFMLLIIPITMYGVFSGMNAGGILGSQSAETISAGLATASRFFENSDLAFIAVSLGFSFIAFGLSAALSVRIYGRKDLT
jgi:ABC-2 type transport system permease protein